MNIQQFQYVLAVVHSKNFQLAAEKCCVTQSTLSTMINKLEDEIGIKIFNRKTKPVSITSEGEKIIERLRIIVNEIDQFDNLVQEIKGETVGNLKIGIIPTIAPYLLPLFINEFADKFPKVDIEIKELTTEQIQKNLLLRNLDIGILALPLEHKDFNEFPLYKEPFLVYDCTGNKIEGHLSPTDLDFAKICLLEDGHCLRTQVYDICQLSEQYVDRNMNLRFASGSMESLIKITESRKGQTILPYLASRSLTDISQKNIFQFKKPVPVRSIGLVTHHFFVKKSMKKALEEIIKNSVVDIIEGIEAYNVIKPI